MASDPPLFREEAVAAASGSQIGELLRADWIGTRYFALFAFCLVSAMVCLAAVVEYSPIYRVPAYVDVSGGLVRMRSPADGMVVSRIEVAQGAMVKAGAALVVLSIDRQRVDGSTEYIAQQGHLVEERAAIERQTKATRDEAVAQHAAIENRVAGLRAEIVDLQTSLDSAVELATQLRQQADRVNELAAQGYYPRLQAAQKRDEVTTQLGLVAAARAALARARRDLAVGLSEHTLTDSRLAMAIETQRQRQAEISRQLLTRESDAARMIRAPVEGTVSSALIAEGQSIALGQLLFVIRPKGQPLLLRLLVPSRAVAAVRSGQEIQFVLQAFPQEKFGHFGAVVEDVSDAPIEPADLPTGTVQTDLMYVVSAKLSKPPLDSSGHPLPIKPGMLGEAHVEIERRTMLEWLIEPLLGGFHASADQPPKPVGH